MIFGLHFHGLGIPFKRLCVFINNDSLTKGGRHDVNKKNDGFVYCIGNGYDV
jgi:hypothetical protein